MNAQDVYWLNLTNIALGVGVALVLVAIGMAVAREVVLRRFRRGG